MNTDEVVSHLIEIKTQMAAHEESDKALRADVRRVLDAHEESAARIGALEREATQLKTSIRIFQWIGGIAVAIVAACIKALKT